MFLRLLLSLCLLWRLQLARGFSRTTRHVPLSPALSSTSYRDLLDDINDSKDWYSLGGCNVLFPQGGAGALPTSIVHFAGGFLLGADGIVNLAYSSMLLNLAKNGHLVVITPIPALTLDHDSSSQEISKLFTNCYKKNIIPLLLGSSSSSSIDRAIRSIPIIGLSHSLGSKLTALMCSRKEDRKIMPYRTANVFLAFNNYGIDEQFEMFSSQTSTLPPDVRRIVDAFVMSNDAKNFISGKVGLNVNKIISGAMDSVKGRAEGLGLDNFIDDILGKAGSNLSGIVGLIDSNRGDAGATESGEFSVPTITPSPTETLERIKNGYNVNANHLFKFSADKIDQSPILADTLRIRGCEINIIETAGGHLTPNAITSVDIGRGRDESSRIDNLNAVTFNKKLLSIINGICNKYWDGVDIDIRRSLFTLPSAIDDAREDGEM